MEMIKKVLKKKEGFTLVELIVVLVILAILAAILVPTLTGYINQANQEKDYATAQTVRVAAQSVATDQYGRKKASGNTTIAKTDGAAETDADKTAAGESVLTLAGVDSSKVTAYSFTFDSDGKMTGTGSVKIGDSTYYYSVANNQWTTTAPTTTTSNS